MRKKTRLISSIIFLTIMILASSCRWLPIRTFFYDPDEPIRPYDEALLLFMWVGGDCIAGFFSTLTVYDDREIILYDSAGKQRSRYLTVNEYITLLNMIDHPDFILDFNNFTSVHYPSGYEQYAIRIRDLGQKGFPVECPDYPRFDELINYLLDITNAKFKSKILAFEKS